MYLNFCGVSYQYDADEFPEGLEELQKEILDGGQKETFFNDYTDWEDRVTFHLEYWAKDGKAASHNYEITLEKQPELLDKIQDFFNQQQDKIDRIFPELHDARHISDVMLHRGDEIIEDGREWSTEEKSMIFKAVIDDLKEGNMAVADVDAYVNAYNSAGENRRSVDLWFEPDTELNGIQWDYSFSTLKLFITDKCTHTLKTMKELKIDF